MPGHPAAGMGESQPAAGSVRNVSMSFKVS